MATLPPGPRSAMLTLWHYMRDPYGSTMRLVERYGDPVTIHSMGHPMVSTGDPALIREILAADPDTFVAFGVELLGPVLGRESLILLSGERHRAARKLLSPPFRGERMRAYGAAMHEIALAEARRWIPGRPFAMQAATQAISLRVILKAGFGIQDAAEMRRYEDTLIAGIAAVEPALLLVKFLQHELWGIGPWAKLQRRMRAMEALVYAELARRRRTPAPREDILSLIMSARYDDDSEMTDRQLYETLMTIVVAGHETTAIAAAWALYFIHRHAAVRERLLAEVATAETPEAMTRLPYLEAVCHETLRLHPVAGSFARLLARPFQLGRWSLPAGIGLNLSATALHRRPELYPEPETFRPERFLERSFGPHEYVPFGGGARRCIGAAFALYELKIVLATILRERPLALTSHRPVRPAPRNTVIGPARPIEFVVR